MVLELLLLILDIQGNLVRIGMNEPPRSTNLLFGSAFFGVPKSHQTPGIWVIMDV